jgi:hypothetical protein
MHFLLYKILVITPIIVLLAILIYRKINESFVVNTNKENTSEKDLLSTRLTTQIAGKLGISIRRIQNLIFTGDLSNNELAVSFIILDANVLESGKGEPTSTQAGNNANFLFTSNQFTVDIDSENITLTKINTSNNSSSQKTSLSDFFNNKGLLESAKYAQKVYDTVPVDETASNFFVLQPDSNFNLRPVMPNKSA